MEFASGFEMQYQSVTMEVGMSYFMQMEIAVMASTELDMAILT